MMLKLRFIFLCGCFAAFISACENPGENVSKQTYFSIENYFKKESLKLNKRHPLVKKTVVQNESKQRQTIRIKDWQKEFGLFIQSDINKPAWRGSYTVVSNKDFIIYTAKLPELNTKKIIIRKSGDKIGYVVIANSVSNFLYSSKERLTYYPDSLYRIEKKQQIKIIGQNRYFIEGKIK